MRSLFPILAALACPVGMCLIPMLLARRRGEKARCAMGGEAPADTLSEGERKELRRLRTEVEALRDEQGERATPEWEATEHRL